jgi:hypothetical protein
VSSAKWSGDPPGSPSTRRVRAALPAAVLVLAAVAGEVVEVDAEAQGDLAVGRDLPGQDGVDEGERAPVGVAVIDADPESGQRLRRRGGRDAGRARGAPG